MDESRTEEADKVAGRITELLSEQTFAFTPIEYIGIHRHLFNGIYDFAGRLRDYNITKKEWILNGDTVLYQTAQHLQQALEYDFDKEKKFNYRGLSQKEKIERIAEFISGIWQIHPFGEGNTRTTAVFLIKYLRYLGYTLDKEVFTKHSWYFRNALVRANYNKHSVNTYPNNEFLVKFFDNLVMGKSHELSNRDMLLSSETDAEGIINQASELSAFENEVLSLIKKNPSITQKQIAESLGKSERTIKSTMQGLQDKDVIARVGSKKIGSWRIK